MILITFLIKTKFFSLAFKEDVLENQLRLIQWQKKKQILPAFSHLWFLDFIAINKIIHLCTYDFINALLKSRS